ncbi:MAG TPA: hypothetical protein VN902_14990 [Candidatus Acidoferrales bacterium]|jgi:hypothetical protein|nr:hypothetical protein [Candidatus Acidoferrales bacterium]
MDLVLRFSFAAQVIAAFVIFVLGYIGLLATLLLAAVVVRCLYETAKWLSARASTKRPAVVRFPHSAGYQSERRIPVATTRFLTERPRAELTFRPALDGSRRASQIIR